MAKMVWYHVFHTNLMHLRLSGRCTLWYAFDKLVMRHEAKPFRFVSHFNSQNASTHGNGTVCLSFPKYVSLYCDLLVVVVVIKSNCDLTQFFLKIHSGSSTTFSYTGIYMSMFANIKNPYYHSIIFFLTLIILLRF